MPRMLPWLFILLSNQALGALIADDTALFTRAELDAGSGPASFSDNIDVDGTVADTGALEQPNGAWYVDGRARASLTSGPQLQARTSATAPGGVFTPSSNSFVRAAWRDLLLPDGPGAPASVSLHFSVDALLAASSQSGSSNFASAIVSVLARMDFTGYQNAVFGSSLSARVRSLSGGAASTEVVTSPPAGLAWASSGFTPTTTPGEYHFQGSFVFTTDLQPLIGVADAPPFGAYFVGVGLGTQTSNVGGSSNADAFSTLALTAITLPDGSALPDGINFAFESGAPLTVIPVPAPALLLLAPLALLARRRRLHAARN